MHRLDKLATIEAEIMEEVEAFMDLSQEVATYARNPYQKQPVFMGSIACVQRA